MPRQALKPITALPFIFYTEISAFSPNIEIYRGSPGSYALLKKIQAVCREDALYERDPVLSYIKYLKSFKVTCTASDESTDAYTYNLIALTRNPYTVGTVTSNIVALFETTGSKKADETVTYTIVFEATF